MTVPSRRPIDSLAMTGRTAPARLRELPPFGEPDTPYPPRPPESRALQPEDPHGLYLPAPEAGLPRPG